MEAIFTLTLDIRNSPFIPGTIVQVLPPDWKLQSGDMTDFLIKRIKTAKYSLDDMLRDFPYRKALDPWKVTDGTELELCKIQAENWNNRRTAVLLLSDVLTKPDLEKVIDIDMPGILTVTPESQWNIMPEINEDLFEAELEK